MSNPARAVLEKQVLLEALPTFPDVLVRLLQSYHTSAMLLVDNSGSMFGTQPQFTAAYARIQQIYGDQFQCFGFHHQPIPGELAPNDFLKSSGLTDLTIPLNQATEALRQGCCTAILFTDGANNAASEKAMYAAMVNFYDMVRTLDPCWEVTFHFITVGNWWPQSTISALSSLFGISNQRVQITVTDVDTFIASGFNAPFHKAGFEEFKSIVDLRNALPPERKVEINAVLNACIQTEEQHEQKSQLVEKPTATTCTTLQEFLAFALSAPGGDVLLSSQMKAYLNGGGAAVHMVETNKTRLKKFLQSGSPFLQTLLPADFNAQEAAALLDVDDATAVCNMLVEVHAIRDGNFHNLSLLAAIAENDTSRFECVLVVPKKGLDLTSETRGLVDSVQSRLGAVGLEMCQQNRINYLVVVLQLGLQAEIECAVQTVGDCWLVGGHSPFTTSTVPFYIDQMLRDLRYTKQGDRQAFSQGGEVASQLAVLWCILGHQKAFDKACGKRFPFGEQEHLERWLGVTGMWARFATDAKNWSLYTLLQTKVDLREYAALILSLRSSEPSARKPLPSRSRLLLDSYVRAASRAATWKKQNHALSRRERNLALAALTEEFEAEAKQTDSELRDLEAACVHLGTESKGEDEGKQQLTDQQAAAVFALSGILDIKALSDHGLAVIHLLERKPKHNTNERLENFRNLGNCLNFGPKRSVKAALEFVGTRCTAAASLPEMGMAATCVNDFLTYVTSFEPLFACPPPTGWNSPAWTELNKLTGINLETVPLTLATEHNSNVLELAKEYKQAMDSLHSGQFKWFRVPKNKEGRDSREICACGSEMVSLTPKTVSLRPQKKKRFERLAYVSGTHLVTEHTREWGVFQLHMCKDARNAVDMIKQFAQKLAASTAESKNDTTNANTAKSNMAVAKWFEDNGGLDVWLTSTYEELRERPTTQHVIVDLEMNDEFQRYPKL